MDSNNSNFEQMIVKSKDVLIAWEIIITAKLKLGII